MTLVHQRIQPVMYGVRYDGTNGADIADVFPQWSDISWDVAEDLVYRDLTVDPLGSWRNVPLGWWLVYQQDGTSYLVYGTYTHENYTKLYANVD